jgi:hypothetical protein
MSASLLLFASLVCAPVHAQEDDGNDEASESEAAKSDTPKAGGLTLEGPYDTSPYARPVLGAVVWGDAYGASIGAEAGLKYQQQKKDPVMFGKTRVRGAYTFGSGISGYDVRVGSFLGPFHKVVGLQAGPDIFYNELAIDLGNGDVGLVATPGMDFPITGLFDVGVFNAYAGISPGWYFGGDRENLNAVMGQFGTYVGAGLNLSQLRLNVGWSRTTTAYGDQDGISVGIGF